MAGITLAQAQAQLDTWLEASTAVAAGQSWSVGIRSLTQVDAAEIQQQVEYWDKQVRKLSSGRSGMRLRGITPA